MPDYDSDLSLKGAIYSSFTTLLSYRTA